MKTIIAKRKSGSDAQHQFEVRSHWHRQRASDTPARNIHKVEGCVAVDPKSGAEYVLEKNEFTDSDGTVWTVVH